MSQHIQALAVSVPQTQLSAPTKRSSLAQRMLVFFTPSALAVPALIACGQVRVAELIFLACIAAALAWLGVARLRGYLSAK